MEEEVLQYKIDESRYKVNIANNIFAIFTESQIKEYFRYKYKVIELKIRINHNINKNEVIEINFNKNY